jgi:hypothetical protein
VLYMMRTRSPLFDALKFDFADEFKSRPIVDSDKPSTQFAAICNSGPAGPRDMKPLQTRAGTRWLNGIPENDSAPGSGQPDCELTKSDFPRRRRAGLRNPASRPPERR